MAVSAPSRNGTPTSDSVPTTSGSRSPPANELNASTSRSVPPRSFSLIARPNSRDGADAPAPTAETAEHRDAPAGTAMPRESRHQRERVDHLVQTLDLDDPALIQHGADDLRRAGERPRVRQHRLARVLRLADFQDDDR